MRASELPPKPPLLHNSQTKCKRRALQLKGHPWPKLPRRCVLKTFQSENRFITRCLRELMHHVRTPHHVFEQLLPEMLYLEALVNTVPK